MKSLRFLDRRAGYSLASLGLLLGMVVPAVFPAFASAAVGQVTSRSMQLSSSVKAATGVTYKLKFTPATTEATGHIVLLFCDDSPVPGQACNAPSGFSVASAAIGTDPVDTVDAGVTIVGTPSANAIELSDTHLTAGTPSIIVLTGVTNPTNVTTLTTGFYARIHTYANSTDAGTAFGNMPDPGANVVDDGGIAMAITEGIGITAAVRESMTFCVSHVEPTVDCGHDYGHGTQVLPDNPSLVLGEGSPQALTTTAVSHGDDYAQLSTNASGGAVVNLKTSNNCGGLMRTGASGCDIAAQNGTSGITAGTAFFGVKLGATGNAPNPGSDVTPSGTLTPAANYSNYHLDFSGNGQGVASSYGSTLFSTTGAVNNQDILMTFGASSSNVTPAGLYGATLNLIATGTY